MRPVLPGSWLAAAATAWLAVAAAWPVRADAAPDNYDAQMKVGQLCIWQQEPARAIPYYERALKLRLDENACTCSGWSPWSSAIPCENADMSMRPHS